MTVVMAARIPLSGDRHALVQRGKRLAIFSIGYNSLEGVVSIIAGLISGSISLVGFGMDSLIEVASGGAAYWRLHADFEPRQRERSERLALRVIGLSFLALAAYVLGDAALTLAGRDKPDQSIFGIAIAVGSLIVMPVLARAKRSVARGLSSAALDADAKQTDICVYLSAILLGGLVLNAALGWWWADPLAALAMVPLIAREGVLALQGKTGSCEC